MAGSRATGLGIVALAVLVAGCTEREAILPGERLGIREVLQTRASADDVTVSNAARGIALPAQSANADWAQSPVSPFARVTHARLSPAPQPAWSVSIGAGDTRRQRLNADPVVADGRIFTMDSANVVRATSTGGAPLWSHDLTPLREGSEQAQGGGFAVAGGRVFVASGFGTLTALDVSNGAELWTQRLSATATGAPSVANGVVYVTGGDRSGWAVEAEDGRVRWQVDGVEDVSNVAGAPAPAVGDKAVIFAYGSGSVQAAFREGGLRLWNADLLGRRNGSARANINDITGDPLIDGDRVYVGTHSGRVAALSVFDGERIWTARDGALGPIWPVGGSVFFVSDLNQLVRLDADSGERIWAVDLPGYLPSRNPNRRRDEAYANMGPVLAGGRLVVASSDGALRFFSPEDGSLTAEVAVPGGATTRPVVAGGVLYVVSTKGVLHAFR
ncbi:PQQ-like beta-propeller repeat protein [Thetidibacter halocola]|uniref:PQQ-binding-like beta-propeller repeat protein n=1 Tax=Thetidibacter halocola TaxID=2827239 RepID=A0A8J8B8G9_9RHOB|nr:PQQ-like beta-propeller repeat protein [Thetidibacter halocola]MBS0123153.1 PQQ-binding-like beta-propeller repeat protein [Thetidibacter halocola]